MQFAGMHEIRRIPPLINPFQSVGPGILRQARTQPQDSTMSRPIPGSHPAPHGLLQLQSLYGNRRVQRLMTRARQAQGEADVDPEVESTIERARGGGQPLDRGVRAQMESAFGADFQGVRIHTGAEAHSLNRAVSAVAFTTGKDIFFNNGAYDPNSAGGRELLAHELTHVVQQAGYGVRRKLAVGPQNDQYEQEADHVARLVASTIGTYSPDAVQRQSSCGAHADSGGECAECRKKREHAVQQLALQRRIAEAIQRRVVCPPGVSEEDGTGCYEVADGGSESSNATAPATPSGANTSTPPDAGTSPAPESTSDAGTDATNPDATGTTSALSTDGGEPKASYSPAEEANICSADEAPASVSICDRDFAGKLGTLVPARHCFVWYHPEGATSTPGTIPQQQTGTYDPNTSGTADAEPNKKGTRCLDTFNVDPNCVKEKYDELCSPKNFDLGEFNCCSCANQALTACGASTKSSDFPPENQGTGLPESYGSGWKKKLLYGIDKYFQYLGKAGMVPIGL